LRLVSGPTCSTGSPNEIAVASAVDPIVPPRLATSGAATSKPEPVKPRVPRSVKCGARKPRLTFAVTVTTSDVFSVMPPRNAKPLALSSSSGQSGWPLTRGLSEARAR
jgi:hypothetical protein